MNAHQDLPPELWDDPILKKLSPLADPPDGDGPIKIDIVNAGLQELAGEYQHLTDLTSWLDLRVSVAQAVRSNNEEAYDRAKGDRFAEIPKSEGPEDYRWAKAEQKSDAELKTYQGSRMRHEVYKSELRRLERQLKVVDATIWVRKAVMAGKGY